MSTRSLADRGFTDATREIVEQIVSRARARGLFELDPTSAPSLALWTLVRWERKVGLVALQATSVELDGLAHRLDELLTRIANENPPVYSADGSRIVWDPLSRLKPLLDEAELIARTLHHNYVGSEHLLLAIITKADPELTAILDEHSISYERTKEAILSLLQA